MLKVMCATDFSHKASEAVRKASAITKNLNGEIVLLHTVNLKFFEKILVGKRRVELREDLTKRLEKELSELGAKGRVYAELGNPSEVILDVARLENPTLLVLGDHGEYKLKDKILGTTARHTIERANIPILIVKKECEVPYKKIVLSTDFSQSSLAACNLAIKLFPEAHFVLLNSFQAPNRQTAKQYKIDQSEIESMICEMESEHCNQLEQFKSSLTSIPAKLDLMTVGSSSAVDDILTTCEKVDANLLVMGTKGVGAIVPLTVGSITDSLVRHSNIDMLIYKG